MEIAVFLRAINLGSTNQIPMSELRIMLEEAGFSSVRTYLNSGNLTMEDQNGLEADKLLIRELIQQKFKLDIDVFAVSTKDLRSKVDRGIFGQLAENQVAYVVFLQKPVKLSVPCDLQHIHLLALDGTMLFCIGTMSEAHTSFPNALIETTFKQRCTSRNLNTLEKILKAS